MAGGGVVAVGRNVRLCHGKWIVPLWASSFPSKQGSLVVVECASLRRGKSESSDKWDIDFHSCFWMYLLQASACAG